MRRVSLALMILAASAGGCSALKLPAAITVVPPPALKYVMALSGPYGIGSGCPVAEDIVLTALHVAKPYQTILDFPPQQFRWSDGAGGRGMLKPDSPVPGADGYILTPARPLAHWYLLAKYQPDVGAKLWLRVPEWGSQDHALEWRRREVTVTQVVAGGIVFKPAGERGGSGGCLSDAQENVIGVYVWAPPAGLSSVGFAFAVYDPWMRIEPAASP